MAGAYVVILREVIAAGVTGSVLSDLRFVHSYISQVLAGDLIQREAHSPSHPLRHGVFVAETVVACDAMDLDTRLASPRIGQLEFRRLKRGNGPSTSRCAAR